MFPQEAGSKKEAAKGERSKRETGREGIWAKEYLLVLAGLRWEALEAGKQRQVDNIMNAF